MDERSDKKKKSVNELNKHFLSLQSDFGIGEMPLRNLSHRKTQVFHPDTTLRETFIALNQTGADAGLVAQQTDAPLGIVTLRNLLDAVTVQGGGMDDPVIAFMTAAPLSLPVDAPVHRAKVIMTRSRLSHLMLTEANGCFSTLISQTDIPGFREGGADDLTDQINTAKDIETVESVTEEVRKLGAELFVRGMGVEALCQWMSGLNDLITMQVIELIADKYDLPPVQWCWIVFGSEGRLEQTFATDQDNGLIFQPDTEEDTEKTRLAFLLFAKEVTTALDQCGFDLCKGGIMASNREWCLSVKEWKEKFSMWMIVPEPDALLNSAIFFDFRPIYGQDELVYDLRSWLLPQPAQHERLLYGLCTEALSCVPAIGFMGRFIYEADKASPNTINLKMNGARPFVDAARIWGLKHQAWVTNTADRLRSAADNIRLSAADTAATIEAFDFIQRLRIYQQLSRTDTDKVNRINPKKLNNVQKLLLKEAFKQAKSLQAMLKQEFNV
jgi:CBS domain-containing protein